MKFFKKWSQKSDSLIDIPSLGLLAIQNSPSLQNLSGFDELETVGMLVIAFLGNDMVDMDAFNSLRTAGTIIITRNMVRSVYMLMLSCLDTMSCTYTPSLFILN